MKCFKCDKLLEQFDTRSPEWVSNGMRFSSHGGYGSKAFDSIGSAVSIFVCDECFMSAAKAGELLTTEVVEPARRATWRYRPWDPEVDE